MKTEEDEAFDEIARKQNDWGGGFKAKQGMAADKLQEDRIKYGTSWEQDGERIDPISVYKEPEQEPVAWITPDGKGFRIRFSPPTNDVPLGWDALYTTPPQREWVGLTAEETSGFTQHEMTVVKYVSKVLQEKNNG